MSSTNDLAVIPLSNALKNKSLDLIVTGSIAAVETIKFIRSLRRLGAIITPHLSFSAKEFVTQKALDWAANKIAGNQYLAADTFHIAQNEALIIAPATANFISKIANGIADDPLTSLTASYLGQNKPVFFVPTMHESLYNNPLFQTNLNTLLKHAHFFLPCMDEGKLKFPEPNYLANEIAHHINASKIKNNKVLITMGSTRNFLDDIRYISNFSTGKLGTLTAEELYRYGFKTHVVCGLC